MPKLTLRDLFAVVTILAVLVAWWLDHRDMAAAQDILEKSLLRAGGQLSHEIAVVREAGFPMTLGDDGKLRIEWDKRDYSK
jgi:hypothetical protein